MNRFASTPWPGQGHALASRDGIGRAILDAAGRTASRWGAKELKNAVPRRRQGDTTLPTRVLAEPSDRRPERAAPRPGATSALL